MTRFIHHPERDSSKMLLIAERDPAHCDPVGSSLG